MKKLFKLFFAFASGVVVLWNVPTATAQTCSDKTLKGSFGYTVTGTIVSNVGVLVAGPFVAVGRITFDGVGGVRTVRSLNDNGNAVQHDPGTGTYSMNSDCTGSFTITVGPPQDLLTLSLDIVLDDLYELRGVVTTQGVVLAFQGKKQFPFNY
jgi:hypothetical protein